MTGKPGMGGGPNPMGMGMPGQMMGQDPAGIILVEDKEKIAEMEAQLEREKREI